MVRLTAGAYIPRDENDVVGRMEFAMDATIKADLMGEVRISFRSETFPLEKMVNTDQFMHLNQAQGGARGTPAAPPPAPTSPWTC